MSGNARDCGDCSLCCKVFFVGEFEKKAGDWCRHCSPGRGCGIHSTRPAICRDFFCFWISHPELPNFLKPNRSKVILTGSRRELPNGLAEQSLLVHCDADDPSAWRREPTYSFLKRQTRSPDGRPQSVIIWAGKRVWMLTPQGAADLGVASGSRTFEVRLDADGKPVADLTESTPPPPSTN